MHKATSLFLAVFFALLFFPGHGYALDDQGADVAYEVAIHDPSEGLIDVTATFHAPPRSNLTLFEWNIAENLDLRDFKATDGEGHALAVDVTEVSAEGFKRLSSSKIYTIRSRGARVVVVTYRVKPGAIGKHGHVGYLDKRFGLVSGNSLFLFPDEWSGMERVALRFTLPQGWKAVCPWKEEGGVFVVKKDDYPSSLKMLHVLGQAVIGFGDFRVDQKEIRGFNIMIYTFAGWPQAYASAVCEQVFALADYQLRLFDIDKKWDYAVIFVPRAQDGQRVFGGCGSLGQGFEMSQVTSRGYELFSHRLHHVFNAYDPFGIRMDRRSGGWFLEATASYYEIKALASLGYYALEDRIARLKEDYRKGRPAYDAELSRDAIVSSRIWDRAQRYETMEFLHYTKAPLVVYRMDEKIKKDTGGQKDLDGFLKYVYAGHGMKKGRVDLKKELQLFAGSDFGDFFRKYVDGQEELP
jgi:predicted metalloprotease with PDZ domain